MYYEYHVEEVEFPKLQEVLCILGRERGKSPPDTILRAL